jgi:tetratricopeptide (TPR) repeat protein
MGTDLYTNRLSDYLDGEDLAPPERSDIEAHLAACSECRVVLDELREVASIAAGLPDRAPNNELWSGIAPRLGATPAVVPFVRPAQRRFSFTLPQLVAAGLALMVVSGSMVWVSRLGDPRTSVPVAQAEPESGIAAIALTDVNYDEAVADLEKVLEAGRSRLDPETVQILEDNLRTIDLAIEQARKALRNDPESVYLNSHFAASRNRKLALLRRASALAMAQDTVGGS